MLKNPSLFKLNDVIDVPLSHFPESVCKTSSDWINRRRLLKLGGFIMWAFDQILAFLAAEQGGGSPHTCPKSQVSIFVSLAMVLRSHPSAFTIVLATLRQSRYRYRGQDKLPLMVWMMAQASQGDLAVGLYSWAHNLLPLVGSNPQTRDLILQLVEKILSNPNAPTILVNKAISNGKPLIPPPSFEILLRLTFPAPSARVKATERFEAIYPVLKEVALAGRPGSRVMKEVTQQIFTSTLKLPQQGSPVLAKEATEIAIWCVTENVDCCNHWGSLYMQNLEASVALLKKLVDEWKDHSLKLSSSKRDTFTLIRTMQSFRLKNEKAITEGGANGSLYKEADESCKVILGRLGRGRSCLKGTASPRLSLGSGWLKGTAITDVVLAAAGVLSFNLEATTHWICTYSSMQPPQP
ncbi:hypothetical protein V5N11_026387 [Cardamine amara subsp. amara]|uniref:Uncharacterized protein n=1 Tax=Cardamine amara subsp. amara TaxID=228776 RepID=A0ABD1AZJ3_CARAN